jgi:hypothetical protein
MVSSSFEQLGFMTSKKTKPKAEKLEISSRFKKFEQDFREFCEQNGSRGKRNRKSRVRVKEYSPRPAEALAEQKRVRELLTQSRELLKQMQAG